MRRPSEQDRRGGTGGSARGPICRRPVGGLAKATSRRANDRGGPTTEAGQRPRRTPAAPTRRGDRPAVHKGCGPGSGSWLLWMWKAGASGARRGSARAGRTSTARVRHRTRSSFLPDIGTILDGSGPEVDRRRGWSRKPRSTSTATPGDTPASGLVPEGRACGRRATKRLMAIAYLHGGHLDHQLPTPSSEEPWIFVGPLHRYYRIALSDPP
jgi:hypothetical protein